MSETAAKVGILWLLVALVLLGLLVARSYFEPYWSFWVIIVTLFGLVGTAFLWIKSRE